MSSFLIDGHTILSIHIPNDPRTLYKCIWCGVCYELIIDERTRAMKSLNQVPDVAPGCMLAFNTDKIDT